MGRQDLFWTALALQKGSFSTPWHKQLKLVYGFEKALLPRVPSAPAIMARLDWGLVKGEGWAEGWSPLVRHCARPLSGVDEDHGLIKLSS